MHEPQGYEPQASPSQPKPLQPQPKKLPHPTAHPHPVQPRPAARPAPGQPVQARLPTTSRGEPVTQPVPAGRIRGSGLPAQASGQEPGAADVTRQAAALDRLTRGAPVNTVNPLLMKTMENTPHVSTLVGSIGRELTANLLMGSTRALASRPAAGVDRLTRYTRPLLNGADVQALAQQLKAAKQNGTLAATLSAFEAAHGKSLQTVLGERVQDTAARSQVLALLPGPISRPQLTRDVFYENIAVSFAYSNASAADMNAKDKTDERRGGQPGAVLGAFGYTAGESLDGAWGMQMRVFTPDPKKGKGQPVIIAFRGTEGLTVNENGNPEGALDTLVGDFARKEPGVNQFRANTAWMDRVVKAATASGQKVVFVGHSLGGALAQEAAARYAGHTAGVVTFQGANVPKADADKVAAYNKANPKGAIAVRQYRVEGDVVPTSGTAALPGDIYYFDRVSRPAGSTGPMQVDRVGDEAQQSALIGGVKNIFEHKGLSLLMSGMPYFSLNAISSGHVTPALSSYLQGLRLNAANDPKLQALLDHGIRDEQELSHLETYKKGEPMLSPDGKPITTRVPKDPQNYNAGDMLSAGLGHPPILDVPVLARGGEPKLGPNGQLRTPLKEVGAVFAGQYTTAADPRLKAEPARAHVVPEGTALANGGAAAQVFEHNIAFNTAMHHLFGLAADKKYTTLEQFQQAAVEMLNTKNEQGRVALSMLPEDVELALQQGLDKSPRANAQFALKDLAGLDRNTVTSDATIAGLTVGGVIGEKVSKHYALDKFDAFINEFSSQPTLAQYHKDDRGRYQVELNEEVLGKLRQKRIKSIWELFHPKGLK